MPTIKDFFENEMVQFDTNCANGGCVGITYEKDGLVLFGVEAAIHRATWFFYAIKEQTYLQFAVLFLKEFYNCYQRSGFTPLFLFIRNF